MTIRLTLSLQFAKFEDVARHRTALPRHVVTKYLKYALLADVESAEITVRVVDAEEGQALNASYRKKDYATNVLTFDYTQAPHVAADLVLCAPVIALEAKDNNKTLTAHYAHLLVHGALHAQGFDHENNDADAEAMEALEVQILAALGVANPYKTKSMAKTQAQKL